MRRAAYVLWLALAIGPTLLAQETPFSGPQAGEPLLPFQIRLAIGAQEGEVFDPVTAAQGAPTLIVFVHAVTRPSIGLTRAVVNYANRFREQGLSSTVVFLNEDPTDAQSFVRRARHALPNDVPMGTSPDGLEGPGAYGLNRKVSLTILVGKEAKVTANFALVQPSFADAPKIGAAIQSVLGKDHQPDLAEMGVEVDRGMARVDDGVFRRLLGPVIRREATPEQVAEAAKAVEAAAAENPAIKQRLGQAARRIVQAGVVQNYGTPAAQELIRQWADKYGADANPSVDSPPSSDTLTPEKPTSP